MQIHEITQLNEGIVDTLKIAFSRDPAIDGMNYNQAKQYLATNKSVNSMAKKAQQAWELYVKQLENFAATVAPSTTPAITPKAPAAQTTPTPGTRIITPSGAVNKGNDGQWKTQNGELITNPADIAELERRSKQQATLAAQNKQMSPASGIKEATSTVTPGGIARRSASRNAPISNATPANTSTVTPTTQVNALTAFRNRTDGKYEQALKSFVQKNLLSGMQYSRLANAQEIDSIIKSISSPQNADPIKQEPLWQQLALAAATAYTVPQSSGGLEAPTPSASDEPPTDTNNIDPATLVDALKQSDVDASKLTTIGKVVRQNFTDNNPVIKSTGNSAVDTLLKSMGFSI